MALRSVVPKILFRRPYKNNPQIYIHQPSVRLKQARVENRYECNSFLSTTILFTRGWRENSTLLMIFVSFETILKEPSFLLESENGVFSPFHPPSSFSFPCIVRWILWGSACVAVPWPLEKSKIFSSCQWFFFFSRSFVFFMITFKIRAS